MIKIGMAEDQALVRESLAIVLGLEHDMEVVWEAANGLQAVNALKENKADIVLMDLRMPELDGVSASKQISIVSPETKIIILTTFDHDEWILDALHAGASFCFLKEIPPKLLIEAIRCVYHQQFHPDSWSPEWRRYAPEIQFKAKVSRTYASSEAVVIENEFLTSRELEVLKRIGSGQTNSEIAKALFLSEGTVKNYVSSLYYKIGVKNRNEAIRLARKLGLITSFH
ncbi:response regulator transcription factor [Bacillus sp. BRMEA1]|uniref:response regulator transcription factor n=1 Tax=Neobacillus endophyticus TaxID=2738405 RepID=UPI001563B73F|nr:response regulator transcription factor [Neobacillus endophyticus]NRD77750.1 response regulator transcription factor [Neobacillus endophyticus]